MSPPYSLYIRVDSSSSPASTRNPSQCIMILICHLDPLILGSLFLFGVLQAPETFAQSGTGTNSANKLPSGTNHRSTKGKHYLTTNSLYDRRSSIQLQPARRSRRCGLSRSSLHRKPPSSFPQTVLPQPLSTSLRSSWIHSPIQSWK